MPQLKFAPDMCIFLLASFLMTPEVLACFSDSECLYHFLSMCLICIGECVSVMEKIRVMNIKTSMNSLMEPTQIWVRRSTAALDLGSIFVISIIIKN